MTPEEFEALTIGTFVFERPTETTVAHWVDRPEGSAYIGRPTIYGNPFHIGRDGDRTAVINLYRQYFMNRMRNDEVFRLAVHGLKGRVLVCHCKPMDCHGDVIAEYLNGLTS